MKIGIWDGGAADEANEAAEWVGGHTDLTNKVPFIIYVKQKTIEDYTTSGTTYTMTMCPACTSGFLSEMAILRQQIQRTVQT